MPLRNQNDVENYLNELGKNFVNGAANAVQEFIKKDINSELYGRKPSKYYDRTNRIDSAIVISKLQNSGTSRKRVARNVEFDFQKLPKRQPVYARHGIFGGTRTMVKFGAHVSQWNQDNRRWMPQSIEEGWTTFAGRGQKKWIEGTHSFEKARNYLRDQMKSAGATGWISGGYGNIKIQKTK